MTPSTPPSVPPSSQPKPSLIGVLSEGRQRGGNALLGVALAFAASGVLWTLGVLVFLYFRGRL